MPVGPDLFSVAEAAEQLGLSPSSVRYAVSRGVLKAVALHPRLNAIHRSEIERYRREHLGQRGKRMLPDEALTAQQRKQRHYQHAYYQRRKAARQQQPATEPAE
jgi:excisionase family DNA binding protein